MTKKPENSTKAYTMCTCRLAIVLNKMLQLFSPKDKLSCLFTRVRPPVWCNHKSGTINCLCTCESVKFTIVKLTINNCGVDAVHG